MRFTILTLAILVLGAVALQRWGCTPSDDAASRSARSSPSPTGPITPTASAPTSREEAEAAAVPRVAFRGRADPEFCEFEWIALEPAGTYFRTAESSLPAESVTVRSYGRIEGRAGTTESISVSFEIPGSLEVRILAEGVARPEVLLTSDVVAEPVADLRRYPDDRFRAAGLAPGDYRVVVATVGEAGRWTAVRTAAARIESGVVTRIDVPPFTATHAIRVELNGADYAVVRGFGPDGRTTLMFHATDGETFELSDDVLRWTAREASSSLSSLGRSVEGAEVGGGSAHDRIVRFAWD